MKLVWLLMYLVSFQSERVDEHERRSLGWASNSIKDIYFLIHLTCEWHIFNQLVAVYFSFKRWQLISMSTDRQRKMPSHRLVIWKFGKVPISISACYIPSTILCGEKYAIKQRKWNENQTYRDKKYELIKLCVHFFTLNIITPTNS